MEHVTDGYRPTTQIETNVKVALAKRLRKNQTRAEQILWCSLLGNRLKGYHFRKQHPIAGFVVDFYCHRANLVVEVDGAIHQTQEEYDKERDAVLKSMGLRVLRFSNDDISYNLRHVVLKIGSELPPDCQRQPPSRQSGGEGGLR